MSTAATGGRVEELIDRLAREKDACFDRMIGNPLQDAINAIQSGEGAREYIGRAATVAHAAFPQYESHWSGEEWQVGVIGSRVRTKGGVAFERGDVILWHERTAEDICFAEQVGLPPHRTAYSIRTGVDTGFNVYVRPLGGKR
jgi:hypothetical protein